MLIIFNEPRTRGVGVWALLSMLLLPATEAYATRLPTPDTYSVVYTPVAPVINGLLDDKLWSQTARTGDYIIHDSGKPSPVQTYAQLAYDKDYLYLAITSDDKDIYAHYTEHQSPLFRRDDLVEVFIDPDGDGKHYLEVGFSARAVAYSLLVPEVRHGKVEPEYLDIPDLLYATDIQGSLNNSDDEDQRWTLEARIPLALLKSLQKNQTLPTNSWRLGLFRIDYDSHSKTNQASGYYAWQYLGQFGFHRPERFGYAVFEPAPELK